MSVPDSAQYMQMLDAAAEGGYAYPSVNVTSTETLKAALRGFAEAESDGMVQLSTGGAAYLLGRRRRAQGDRSESPRRRRA